MKAWMCVLIIAVAMFPTLPWAFEFSADRILKEGGKTTWSSVKATSDRWRFEYAQPQGWAQVCIVRQDRQSAWLVLSTLRAYVEVPVGQDHDLFVTENMEGEIARELIGTQDLHGYPTEFFEVTAVVKGKLKHYYQWVTTGERFAIKTIGKEEDWSLEYKNVRFSPQRAKDFDPPKGFRKGKLVQSGF